MTRLLKGLPALLVTLLMLVLAACDNEAAVASRNVSRAADQFEVMRRITFINGITDTYLLTIEGLCSLGNYDKTGELSVTCKVGPSTYKKHFLGLSQNVTYVVEQVDAANVSGYHYRVVFRPTTLLPALEADLP